MDAARLTNAPRHRPSAPLGFLYNGFPHEVVTHKSKIMALPDLCLKHQLSRFSAVFATACVVDRRKYCQLSLTDDYRLPVRKKQ